MIDADMMRILEQTYYKILKINLSDDSYEVIHLNNEPPTSYKNLSTWYVNFVKNKQVHPDDIADFMVFFKDLAADKDLYYRRWIDDKWIWVHLHTYKDTETTIWMTIQNSDNDFIERLSHQNQLEYENIHDSLTNLLNRTAYDKYISNFISEDSIAIIYMDLNRLKFYNDTYGHAAGDAYIKNFATCLKHIFRSDDCYRYGGDEFIVILPGITVLELQSRIIALYDALGKQQISCAIGYSWQGSTDNKALQNLIAQAEINMYQNKRSK